MERWIEISEFPGYSISDHGRVRNDYSGRILSVLTNQSGVLHVGMSKGGRQYKRSIAKLVAEVYLPRNTLDIFNTPMHLDGDRSNNYYENLMWRPKWFADAYYKQFLHDPYIGVPIELIETGEVFEDSQHAYMTYGILDFDIVRSVMEGVPVRMTYQHFRTLE